MLKNPPRSAKRLVGQMFQRSSPRLNILNMVKPLDTGGRPLHTENRQFSMVNYGKARTVLNQDFGI